jgi:hypothetical protein
VKAERVEEIREVIWCEPWKDPQLFPDLLVRVFNELAAVATTGGPAAQAWATDLLEVLDLRARSGIPFDEPYDDQPPTDPEDL